MRRRPASTCPSIGLRVALLHVAMLLIAGRTPRRAGGGPPRHRSTGRAQRCRPVATDAGKRAGAVLGLLSVARVHRFPAGGGVLMSSNACRARPHRRCPAGITRVAAAALMLSLLTSLGMVAA